MLICDVKYCDVAMWSCWNIQGNFGRKLGVDEGKAYGNYCMANWWKKYRVDVGLYSLSLQDI